MSGRTRGLERAIEAVLTAGVLLSGLLLLAGLVLEGQALLKWGILLLMLTPVARVVVVTAGLLRERDWAFALVSLWILAVLATSIWVATRPEPSRPDGGFAPAREAAPASR